MKVYPISVVQMRDAPNVNAAAVPHVQVNVDANEGLTPHEFGQFEHNGNIAIVGYGPSLKRTWEQLRQFDTIWTVSGAHDFLAARGISPTFHTDIDFRKHKLDMVTPQHHVRYIMGNTIHPEYAHKLKGYRTSYFQPIGEKSDKWFRYAEKYPRVKLDGDVAMAAMILAAKEGFKHITTFGIDCSEEPDGSTHADAHGGVKHEPMYVTGGDYTLYRTTNNLLVGAATFVKVVRSLPEDVSVTVVSDGLLPAWIDMVEGQDG